MNGNFQRFLLMLPDCYLLVKNSWLRIGDIVSLSDLLVSSERTNFLESDLWLVIKFRFCLSLRT